MSKDNGGAALDDAAQDYLELHGRFMRDGVYSVRYPLFKGTGLITATSTDELKTKLKAAMITERAKQ